MKTRYIWLGILILTLVSLLIALTALAGALHDVAKQGDLDQLKRLIAAGADIHASDGSGNTPLHSAAEHGQSAVVEWLIDQGAVVNAKNTHDYMPLHRAAFQGHTAVAERLIAAGANFNAIDKGGFRPLDWAVANGQLAVAERLVAAGADANATDPFGTTPLHWAAENGHADIAALLLANGADVNAQNSYGDTPLHWAAENGYESVAEQLIAGGGDLNSRDQGGDTPLHRTAGNGQIGVAKQLIDAGADVNAQNSYADTPLHRAADYHQNGMMELLIAAEADTDIRNEEGKTPIQWAAVEEYRPALSDNLSGVLKKIWKSGTIAIGHRESSMPFSYLAPGEQPIGYSVDLCLEIVEAIKAEIGVRSLNIQWVPVNPQTRLSQIAEGAIQLECGSTTNTFGRQRQVDFSHTTFISGAKLLVKKDSAIEEIEDLGGKRVALARATTTERLITALMDTKGLDIKIRSVNDHSEGLQALENGQVDAYVSDHALLHGLRNKAKHPDRYQVVGEFLSYEPYAIMLPRNDSDYRLVVNRKLAELFHSGEIETIYNKWFVPLGMPLDAQLSTAFELQALPK